MLFITAKRDSPHIYRLSLFSIAPSLSVLVVIVIILLIVVIVVLLVVIVVLLVVVIVAVVIVVVVVVHEIHLLIVTSIVCLNSEKLYFKTKKISKEIHPCF